MYLESAWATRPRQRSAPALIAALLLSACASTPGPTVVPKAPPPTAVEPPPRLEPAPREEPAQPSKAHITLTIAAVGDMMLGTDYPENRLPDDDAAGFLSHVAATLNSTDLTFGNLEGVLADGGEPAKKCRNLNACYLFRSPTRYAAHLRAAGFDALSLANNHARDFGEAGRTSTMRALRNAGIAHSGREGDFASLQHNGLSIAFLAFAVTRDSNLVHDYPLAEKIVREQAARHDIVVVSFHGGAEGQGTTRIPFDEEEYYGEPRGNVVRFARTVVDAGADLVFGHGPHVVRGMERYKERLIAYSLGNFATYYGISVADIKGVAPILLATLDGDGRFLGGRIQSTVQIRPGGPRDDPDDRARKMIAELTAADFRDAGLEFRSDGQLLGKPRTYVRKTADY